MTVQELAELAASSGWTPGIPSVEFYVEGEEVEGVYLLRDHNGSILGEAYEVSNSHYGIDNARLWQNAAALWCVLWRLTEAVKSKDQDGIRRRIEDAELVLTRAVRA